jgi:hypothetical protein
MMLPLPIYRAVPNTLTILSGNMYSSHKITLPGMTRIHHQPERSLTLPCSTLGLAIPANLSITLLALLALELGMHGNVS